MTPKEKAIEIKNQFIIATWIRTNEIDLLSKVPDSTECALICVENIISAFRQYITCEFDHVYIDYYLEVKNEIKKL